MQKKRETEILTITKSDYVFMMVYDFEVKLMHFRRRGGKTVTTHDFCSHPIEKQCEVKKCVNLQCEEIS